MKTKQQIIESFIRKFCNNHNGEIRFLRGVFYNEKDGAEQILEFLSEAIDETREAEKIKEISGTTEGWFGSPEDGYNSAVDQQQKQDKEFMEEK